MATIKEVALAAGVSVSTASIVLRGEAEKRKILPQTAEKVMRAAQQLGYQPNVSARRLRAPQTDGLMISIFWASFWAGEFRAPTLQFLRGVQTVLDSCETKCEIMIHPYQRGRLRDNLSRLSLCHAAIVCNATPQDMEALEKTMLPVPVVLHSRESAVLPCVHVDYNVAGQMPVDIFDQCGGQQTVLCVPSARFSGADTCEQAFIRCALERGMSVRRLEVEHTMQGGFEAAERIAAMPNHPDSVFFLSDVLALGSLKGFQHCGLRVPEDVRLISLGSYDADMAEYVTPSLSVIRVPLEEMGAAAFQKALHYLTGVPEERETVIPVRYIARESCGGRYDGPSTVSQ
ncbi:MAG: LacI family DNA-binding transcriptional regulator [Clostridia bacterium]|nr:LacI family DNA-binding transcriptional regulator [Clostridia bacterium]